MIKNFFCLVIAAFTFAVFVNAQETPPQIISASPFTISEEDEAVGIDGTMKVAAEINAAGNVVRASIYVGPEWPCGGDLDGRVRKVMMDAENAVLNFKFKPATKDGKPVESRAAVSLKIGRSAKAKLEQTEQPDPNAPRELKQIPVGVLNGRATSLLKPRYPPEAKAAGAAGAVSVQVLVSEEGKVLTAQAINGSPYFHFVARDAACNSKFAPTRLNGKPVKISGVITYNFIP